MLFPGPCMPFGMVKLSPDNTDEYLINAGYIDIPEDGLYTFYLTTNDGGLLHIDNRLLINKDGLHPLAEVYKPVALKAGLHPISVNYFQEGGTNGLIVSWQGPGFGKQVVPARVLFHKK